MTQALQTKAEAGKYQSALLQGGLGLQIDSLEKASKIRQGVASSDGNPVPQHFGGLHVENMILCGLFTAEPRNFLLLPPSRNALYAITEFLRFEAMRKKGLRLGFLRLAKAIEELGVKNDVLEPIDFKKGDVRVTLTDGTKKTLAGEIIGEWTVAPSLGDKSVFMVRHRVNGYTASMHPFKKKSAAKHLARSLAEMPYPWSVFGRRHAVSDAVWQDAASDGRTAITTAIAMDEAKGKKGQAVENPGLRDAGPLF